MVGIGIVWGVGAPTPGWWPVSGAGAIATGPVPDLVNASDETTVR